MNKYVKVSAGSCTRFVQQTGPRGFEPFHRGVQIGHRQSHVMQTFTALVDELGDHRIGLGGFQQLDARFTYRQHRGVNFFNGDSFAQRHGQPKLIAIEIERLVDGAHGNSEMIDLSA